MTHFIGAPTIDLPYANYSVGMATDDLVPSQERLLGISLPHDSIAGTNWVQLPTADGANNVSMGAYGQWQNGAGAPAVGDWVEWDFGSIRSNGWGIYLWAIHWKGSNLGKVDVSWNGVVKGQIDTYAAAYVNASSYIELQASAAGARVPQKNTLRFTIVTKNPTSTANYILLTSLTIYGAEA